MFRIYWPFICRYNFLCAQDLLFLLIACFRSQLQWFIGVQRVANVRNFNPTGLMGLPFNGGARTVGLNGRQADPVVDSPYTVMGVDIALSCEQPHNVSIQDAKGRSLVKFGTNLAPMTSLAIGFIVTFHSNTTVVVSGN